MRAILFDLDGVLYQGDTPVAGAAGVVAWCQQTGLPHLFVTNTTSRGREALAAKLAGMGIDVAPAAILTPAVAAVQWLRDHVDGEAALFVPPATRAEFESLALASADATNAAAGVVGDLGEDWTFATLNRAFRLLMAEPAPALVALGMTRYWQGPHGLQLDVAPFVVALEHAAGCQATVVGKPAPAFFAAALQRLDCPAAETVMVGDDIRGDVDAAQRAGLLGVLVQTGKYRPRDLTLGIEPYAVLPSIAELPRWWTASDETTR